jgi:hypothetical protein
MAAAFYQIYISRKSDVTAEDVEKKINLAVDWIRLSPSFWIVYTTSDADKWQARLRPFVEPGGRLFICKLDLSDRQGWAPQKFWEWLKKDR